MEKVVKNEKNAKKLNFLRFFSISTQADDCSQIYEDRLMKRIAN